MTPSTGLTDEQDQRILAIIWKEDDEAIAAIAFDPTDDAGSELTTALEDEESKQVIPPLI